MTTMKRLSACCSLLVSLPYFVFANAQDFVDLGQGPLGLFDNDWQKKYGEQFDAPFSGPLSFSHLPYHRCLADNTVTFDIALLGMPFDTAVSYRPGARFGPYAIRSGSRRQTSTRGYTMQWGMNPYDEGLTILDCGDVPVSPFDNALAMDQLQVAYDTLLKRTVKKKTLSRTRRLALDGAEHPRVVSLGGDHTIVLPILRSLHKVYGSISVIHFDAHLDTWPAYKGTSTDQSRVTHGTFFYLAHEEGLLANNSVHAGIRCKMEVRPYHVNLPPPTPIVDIAVQSIEDIENDMEVGFQIFTTDDIDDLGVPEILRRIKSRIGDSAVYLSLDIDVVDPGLAPATGTPEPGGWTTRELKRIIRGLSGLNLVGADIVEVSPAYDHADITGIAAADLVHDLLSLMAIHGA